MDMNGRTVLITGSTSGIGLGIAKTFAAKGANIVLNGLSDPEAGEALRTSIANEFGVSCLFQPANLAEPAQIKSMIAAAEEAFGAIDILINNAGIQHVAPIDEFPEDKLELVIRVDLLACFYTIKSALPAMKKKGWGRIINVASAHALVASPFKSAYIAAKHGVAGLTKTVALEVAEQHITCNAICPGYVWTPLVEKQIPDQMKARGLTEEQVKRDVLLHAQSTKEFVTVDQVAGLASFLASDAAASITGAIIPIDGGWTAH